MFIKYVFLLLTGPLLSQSFLSLEIKPIYIDAEKPEDIYAINFDSIKPYVYTDIPDLSHLDTDHKKAKFINMILPSILIEKEKIKSMYTYVLDNFDSIILNDDTKFIYEYCNCTKSEELILCLSDQPNSIIIAQAAIESGWGTSRFFLEGFNLFGIHSYNKNDIQIKAAFSSHSAPVYVKKYQDILSSVSHYLRTLAKGYAYSEFRQKRVENIGVQNMIKYLVNYSERRELYIEDLRTIIEYNNLCQYDTLKISIE